ncbi:MAG TPA: hypothetical protein VG895_01560 [Patescibacteria group bacterium]|nr:hypothetical protein [Patescibacteria group bacterium]
MKTFVLPGYSTKNKEWAIDAAKEVGGEIFEWQHWNEPIVKFNAQKEAERLIEKISSEKVNIAAKSIGTLVLVRMLTKNKDVVGKIIMCGVPVNDIDENDLSFYKILADVKAEDILVFQNSEDEHGQFEKTRRFLNEINPNIKIIEKPGSTHDYPYFDEFKEFLSS